MARWMYLTMPFVLGACLNDTLGPPPEALSRGKLLAYMTAWPAAITMAVGETQQLVVTATSLDGDLVEDAQTTFTSSADSIVSVDSTGLITARQALTSFITNIIVKTVHKDAGRVDTVPVRVTPTRATVSRISIQPPSEAERKVSVGGYIIPSATVYAADGVTPVPDVIVDFKIMTALSGANGFGNPLYFINFSKRGKVLIHGTAYAYGKEFFDSTTYEVLDAQTASVMVMTFGELDQTFASTSMYLAVNGTFMFTNYTSRTLTVTFDDPSIAPGGTMNVDPFDTGMRMMVKAGSVNWSVNSTPEIRGTVVVR